jgi:two-component system, OmpR family, response regulator
MNILVAEDEKKVASLIQDGLSQHGIIAEVCHDGDEAYRRASSQPFDGLILDIMLPGRDGLSILRKLRAEGHNLPILLLTARGDLEERVEGLNLGADDYLAKPFAMVELVARLRAIQRRRAGVSSNVLAHADVVMNVGTREVRRGEKNLLLTPREFGLLECLLRMPGKVVTRTQLSQQVWGYQFDPGTNVVDVAVKRLRSKLDDGFSEPFIHTLRGVGYLLKDPS